MHNFYIGSLILDRKQIKIYDKIDYDPTLLLSFCHMRPAGLASREHYQLAIFLVYVPPD